MLSVRLRLKLATHLTERSSRDKRCLRIRFQIQLSTCKSARMQEHGIAQGRLENWPHALSKTLSHLERAAVSISDRAPPKSQKVQRRAARDESGRITNRTEYGLPQEAYLDAGGWRVFPGLRFGPASKHSQEVETAHRRCQASEHEGQQVLALKQSPQGGSKL